MAPSLFGAVGASESGSGSSWVVLPHGQFADGAVALVAGWSITPGRHDWAFFRLEPATGRVTQIGVTRPATATRFLGSPLAGAELSRDGRWHMLLFSTASAVEIVIFDPARVEPVKELAFASGGAPRASWSRGGDRVLLRVEDQGAALQTLRVVHMDSKQEVWKRQVPQLVFAELLPDDSVVYVSSKRSAVRVNRDGTERWRVE